MAATVAICRRDSLDHITEGASGMKIMVLSDVADKALWDYLDRRLLEGIDLILSCGDLPADYLSFLTCFTDAPILYVHGNHDRTYDVRPPEGCVCVDDDICEVNGVRVLGLGGVAHQAPWSMGFSRHEYCSGLPHRSSNIRASLRRVLQEA